MTTYASEDKIRKVRRELAILIKRKVKEYPEIKETVVVETCRKFINLKYKPGWRERGLCVNDLNQWNKFTYYKDPEFDWIKELTTS